jgi:hypothetical protein
MPTTNYPDGTTLTSSAYTTAPNGGTIATFLHPIVMGMLGISYDVNSPLVRFAWPIGGAPFQDIADDICYVHCTLRDEPYDKIRDLTETTPGGPSAVNNTEIWNYTRVWNIRFVTYGPNAFDNLRAIRSGLMQNLFTQQLAEGNLFPVSELPEVIHAPELFNAQWWERADMNFDMYEWVTENISAQTILSAQVIVETADTSIPVGPIYPPPAIVDGGGFTGTGGLGTSLDGGTFGGVNVVTFVPVFADNFTPNANPLDPINWATLANNHEPSNPLQAVSGQCESTIISPNLVGYEIVVGPAVPANCYVNFALGTFGALRGNQSISAGFHIDTNPNNFIDGWWIDLLDNGDGTVTLDAFVQYGNGSAEFHVYLNPNYTPTPGDTFTFAAIGTVGYFFINDVQVAAVDCASVNPRLTGPAIAFIGATVALNYPTMSYFEMGQAALALAPVLIFDEPLYIDNFTPNANPLNPANWNNALVFPAQALNSQARPTGVNEFNGGAYIGQTIPARPGQWASVRVTAWTNDAAEIDVSVLGDEVTGNTGVFVDIVPGFFGLAVYFGNLNNPTLSLDLNTGYTPTVGDVLTVAVVGTQAFGFLNGNLMLSGSDPNIASLTGTRAPAFFIEPGPTSISNAAITNFRTGTCALA